MNTFPALGLIEFSSIARGVFCGDAMIKKAPISMVKTGTVSRGKYLVMIGGSVASVEEALTEGLEKGEDAIVDQVFLPHVHPHVYQSALGERRRLSGDALGVFEVKTVCANVRGADAGIKEADVGIAEMRLADAIGGKAFTVFFGTVEDVEAALSRARFVQPGEHVWLHQSLIPRKDAHLIDLLRDTSRFGRCEPLIFEHGEV